ncbi:hypothetical protein J6590_008672 [Homalodisca vitripennis]|nr:hypothetical protein J6590_008672 [Homalodisca vitripennis]
METGCRRQEDSIIALPGNNKWLCRIEMSSHSEEVFSSSYCEIRRRGAPVWLARERESTLGLYGSLQAFSTKTIVHVK